MEKQKIINLYCDKWNYDVCDKCFIKYEEISLGEKKKIQKHEHSLKYSDYLTKKSDYKNINWWCNLCHYSFNKYIPNFYCDKCNFDIYDKYFIKYEKYFQGKKEKFKNMNKFYNIPIFITKKKIIKKETGIEIYVIIALVNLPQIFIVINVILMYVIIALKK